MDWKPLLPTTTEELVARYGGVVGPYSAPSADAPEVTVPYSKKLFDIAALSLPIPMLGYFILFLIFPWIARGFKRDTQVSEPPNDDPTATKLL